MKKRFNRVYQFKISLRNINPPIWRCIQVPEIYTFWDLHVAIQDAMGWLDYHLHEFKVVDPSTGMKIDIGIPEEEYSEFGETIPGWKEKIAEWFSKDNRKVDYIYDFGDDWVHNIELEDILPKEEGVLYPVCIEGKRACPPEDCGGIWGYERLLNIISDKNHEEYEEMIEWLGGGFDPENFDPKSVGFTDPEKRWKFAFS